MRWQSLLLLLLLTGPVALAGCTSAPDDVAAQLSDDEARISIYVKKPMGVHQFPVWTLEAVPRLVAFLAHDNATRDALGDVGYVDAARGWEGWDAENATTEFPAEARRDWLQISELWYEGTVPAGNYSTIRIEIVDLVAEDVRGRPLDVVLMGERLSIGPAEGEAFHIQGGETMSFVFESVFDETSEGRYMIR